MRWEDERYVRLYVRDTVNWMAWPWQARALLPLLLRKVDRAGILQVGRGSPARIAAAVAALVAIPPEVVGPGLAALMDPVEGERATVEIRDGVLLIPSFMEASEVRQTSNVIRQRECRARARDKASARNLLNSPDPMSHDVTPGHETLPDVTSSHSEQSRAEPSRAKKIPESELGFASPDAAGVTQDEIETVPDHDPPTTDEEPDDPKPRRPKADPSPESTEVAEHLLKAIRSHTPDHLSDPVKSAKAVKIWARHLDLALRLDGVTAEQLKRAADYAHRTPDRVFWRANILSGEKLREKFATLRIEHREKRADVVTGGARASPRDIRGVAPASAQHEFKASVQPAWKTPQKERDTT